MGAGRRLLAPLILWPVAGGAARFLTLAALAVILLYYIPKREQAISVSASTEEMVVEVTSNNLTWDLPDIGMCYEEKVEAEAVVAESGGLIGAAPAASAERANEAGFTPDPAIPECGSMGVSATGLKFANITWPKDYTLILRGFRNDHVEVYVRFAEDAAPVTLRHEGPDGEERNSLITQGTTLRIPYMAEGERTILPLLGYVTVGSRPSTASSHILRSGRYEGRQILRGGHAPIVSANELFPGDRVSFERRTPPLWATALGLQSAKEDSLAPQARAFVTDLDPRTRAFDVVVTTERFFGTLLFTRVGGLPTDVTPSWTARLAADALPVALATILGLVATLLALLKSYMPPKVEPAGPAKESRKDRAQVRRLRKRKRLH